MIIKRKEEQIKKSFDGGLIRGKLRALEEVIRIINDCKM